MEEYKIIKEFLEKKSIQLMNHEKINVAKVGTPVNLYQKMIIDNRLFYMTPTVIFNNIIIENLEIALKRYPEKFVTENAKDVINAIFKVTQANIDFDSFVEFLRKEQFCYIFEFENFEVKNKILRIDLFRKLKTDQNNNFQFIGGIFNCFKHFTLSGKQFPNNSKKWNLVNPKELIEKIAEAFFFIKLSQEKKERNDFRSEIKVDAKHNLRVTFYLEKKTGIYFIKTAHIVNN